ncbi:UDP-xylose and UDP-N-acetylglucosamine transporter [Trametes pubescens]|uniref:UDP-xylose and UDP-N-acetylglucosamine transporter n=1 Tax=Trametes pubescens TaxID=154538 RepID=A0A1M2VQC8_TRAPU|nr:UDP-xylose and UDP-N-acetylglucosamine transporter [Trametes pubescens]
MPARKRSAKSNALARELNTNGAPERALSTNGTSDLTKGKGKGKDARAQSQTAVSKAVALSLVDYTLVLSLVFGGCCANVWSYEQLLKMDAHIGTTLTFSQMLFITVQSLPTFLTLPKGSVIPRLRPRQVPLRDWAVQVLVLASGSLLNNWVFAYSVPLTVQIVFRSAGLAVSMLLGHFVLKKRYSLAQMAAVAFVSAGVVLATLSRPPAPKTAGNPTDIGRYTIGVAMLTVSLMLTGVLGVLQERTYTKYGPHWKEGVFYTHCLSLPIFLFFIPDLKRGFGGLADPSTLSAASLERLGALSGAVPYVILGANMLTQLACVSGVNQLTSHVSSVSTNLVLTTRKALSLCFSVWWFGNGWNAQLGAGAGMVFLGSLLYTLASSAPLATKAAPPTQPSVPAKRKGAKAKAQ